MPSRTTALVDFSYLQKVRQIVFRAENPGVPEYGTDFTVMMNELGELAQAEDFADVYMFWAVPPQPHPNAPDSVVKNHAIHVRILDWFRYHRTGLYKGKPFNFHMGNGTELGSVQAVQQQFRMSDDEAERFLKFSGWNEPFSLSESDLARIIAAFPPGSVPTKIREDLGKLTFTRKLDPKKLSEYEFKATTYKQKGTDSLITIRLHQAVRNPDIDKIVAVWGDGDFGTGMLQALEYWDNLPNNQNKQVVLLACDRPDLKLYMNDVYKMQLAQFPKLLRIVNLGDRGEMTRMTKLTRSSGHRGDFDRRDRRSA